MEVLPVPSLTKIQTQDLLRQVIYWITDEALNREQVRKLIATNAPAALTESEINNIINQSLQQLSEEFYSQYSDPIKVINQHVEWYEHIYSYFNSINNAAGCTKALQAKEKLLRLLKDKNTIILSKKQIRITEEKRDQAVLDLDRLTPDEQNRFNYLYQKIKVNG
ncbi:MAG TPA: hypothetical protein VNT20_18335 [Flavisolibacter sp.]|jgi:phosphoglycolate phosphatase-like HAD superfamily hydrolase|nr:hypothetical protein [Flavisolibacter sp.]